MFSSAEHNYDAKTNTFSLKYTLDVRVSRTYTTSSLGKALSRVKLPREERERERETQATLAQYTWRESRSESLKAILCRNCYVLADIIAIARPDGR